MARTDSLNNYLTDVATAIKNKYDITGTINASNFDTTINNGKVDASIFTLSKTGLTQQEMDNLAIPLNNFKNVKLGSFQNGTFTDASALNGQKVIGSISSLFYNCASLTTIPDIDVSGQTSFYQAFSGCASLTDASKFNNYDFTNKSCFGMFENSGITFAPTGMIFSASSSATGSIKQMFRGCANLTTIPYIDLSNFHGAMRYWCDCPSLTDESLNNILLSLSTSDGGSDTQKKLGFIWQTTGSTYASRIRQLSNYQTCINAGWTDNLPS